ncbi:uncharacterized protein LOC135708231 [Ochlerotatus camptorhynchus]|uniref:uncharacterized protein LOC135708231 n=1 Tax=Ochlerotatus camptorhynchus TaxID=644619 RepID=UPI0031E31E79
MQNQSEPKPSTRNPSKCPIIRCPTVLSETALLDHLLTEHKNIDLKPVEAGEKAVLSFQESIFPHGQPICMGLVLYGGKDERSRPTQMGFSQRNSILSSNNLVYENHFPVLVMGCKTHLTDMLADDEIPAEIYNDICQRREAAQDGSDPEKDIFVLWLIGPSVTRPVYGDLTISDSERINVRGCRMQVRDFKDFLLPKTFLSKGLDYLMVNRGGMNLLTRNGKQALEMEVFVAE